MVEQVAYWRRYCKFHDCTAPQVNVTVDAPRACREPGQPGDHRHRADSPGELRRVPLLERLGLRRCALQQPLCRPALSSTALERSWRGRRFPARGRARPEPWVDAGDAAEIGQDRLDLVGGELDLRHVAVPRAHAFGEAFLELLDRIFEIDLA